MLICSSDSHNTFCLKPLSRFSFHRERKRSNIIFSRPWSWLGKIQVQAMGIWTFSQMTSSCFRDTNVYMLIYSQMLLKLLPWDMNISHVFRGLWSHVYLISSNTTSLGDLHFGWRLKRGIGEAWVEEVQVDKTSQRQCSGPPVVAWIWWWIPWGEVLCPYGAW